jgi:penicillin-binding protein 2
MLKLRGVRVFILLTVVILVICSFTLRLMRYQITDGASYRKVANKTSVESIPIIAPRGEILDRNGVVLATNTVGYSVILERATFPSAKSGKENDTILELTDIMTKNGQQWADTLPISMTTPFAFNAGSDADVKDLKTFCTTNLNVKDSAAFNAEIAISDLKKIYSIPNGYSLEQLRTIIGVRHEMFLREFSLSNVFTFAKNVNLAVINQMSERSIPGIEISEQYSRTYPNGTLAPQVIGNVGPIHTEQAKAFKALKYSLDEIVGQGGIESTQESYLHGVNGKENIEVNSLGTVTNRYKTVTPKPGDNVVLTIDAGLQSVLQQALQAKIAKIVADSMGDPQHGANCNSGAAVVLNIKTGEVLAMASYPGYDNNTYYQDYASLSTNPAKPLLNLAVQGTFRPGSTYKPCVAVSGLMNGAITKTSEIYCGGSLTIGGMLFGDDAWYGNLSIEKAIGVSSNVFFYTVAMRLNAIGPTVLEQTAKALGLGQKTGIELTAEQAGVISGPTEKKASGDTSFTSADAAQSGIGQLDNMYTPLQLANYVGTIVNGGKLMQMHIVKEVKSYDNSQTVLDNTPTVVSDLKIPADIVNTVKQGMLNVTKDGTAAAAFTDYSLPVGGKTGTSQRGTANNPHYDGLFLCFAPFDNPQIAIAVAIPNAYWGADTAPVAQAALDYMFLNKPDYSASPLPAASGTLLH